MTSRSLLDVKIQPKPVKTKAWGTVFVRHARADELDNVLRILDSYTGGERLIQLVMLGVCYDTGRQVFTHDDLPKLRKAPLEPITELSTAFLELNGLAESSEKKSSIPSTGSVSTLQTAGAIPSRAN